MTERLLTGGSALAGLAVFGVGLSSVFNPVALGLAAGYAAYGLGSSLLLSFKPYRDRTFRRMVASGAAQPVAENAPVMQTVREVSESLGRKTPPKMYTLGMPAVAKMALPFGLRWIAKTRAGRQLLREKVMPKLFAALPGANTMITTQEALNARLSPAQMRFIVAHEMSHLKADKMSPVLLAKAAVKSLAKPLSLAVGAGLVLSMFGVGVPLTLGAIGLFKAGAVLYGAKALSTLALNFGSRVVEKRADRNALYVTRDLKGATDTMDYLHDSWKERRPNSVVSEAMLDHPGYVKRMEALRESFNMVSKYPAPGPGNDNRRPERARKPAAPKARARG